jgi:hypothetical protein
MSVRISPKIPWSHEWARAAESFLENPLCAHTRDEARQRATDAIIANDARKLGRFIYPIGELREKDF